jgi:alkylation response protein AidB-like acyl-CoA dehydrogenase
MSTLKGGEFLIRSIESADMFIPEEWNEEQRMIAQTCQDFLEAEIFPNLDRLDAMEEGLMPAMLDKAGELGLLGISVPEEYGGFGKDFLTSMLVTEVTGRGHSFAVSLAAHTGIGTLPILYFGNESQRAQYIPKLATGEWKAAYCLTEPGSGSDANSGKTKAELSADGSHYLLNGQKMWITNGGFADVFTVFAKIGDDENLSAFIVDAHAEGVSLNAEEKKMGIKGSSTRQVFFNNVKVPAANLLGERQGGFKIALYILNIGRIKLAGATLGGMKQAIDHSVRYANEREQFGRAISKYGAIRAKLGEQAIQTFAVESATYRCSQNIDDAIASNIAAGMDKQQAVMKACEEYAVEAAILKVFGSEALDFVVDEAVQIYGGMGFSAESPVERSYRDSRINRIFEGTNEINRMLIIDMLMKKAMKGQLDLMGPAQKVAGELMDIPDFSEPSGVPFEAEKDLVARFRKATLLVAGAAAQKLMMELAKEQEVVMAASDMVSLTYICESLVLRVEKLYHRLGAEKAAVYMDIMHTYLYDAADRMLKLGKDAVSNFASDDELRMMLSGLRRFTKTDPVNTRTTRRNVAAALIAENRYCF